MKISLLVLVWLSLSLPAFAQAATVSFDAATGTTPATANTWSSVLYVNGTAFPMTHVCTLVGTTTTCTATLPNISAALTPVGTQTFTVTFKDSVLGESPQSSPLVKVRPAAPVLLRIQ
jgi:hypothetical protein